MLLLADRAVLFGQHHEYCPPSFNISFLRIAELVGSITPDV